MADDDVRNPAEPHPSTEPSASVAVEEKPVPESEKHSEKYQELHEQYLRLAADFENFRKRYAQEQEALRQYGAENTLRQLIPVMDNLERATASLSETSDPKLLYQSFRLVYNQLLEGLAAVGLKRMDTVGHPFDPNYHEAISQVETADHPDQTVVTEMQSGFLLRDKVLRPAMVAVSVAPSPPESEREATADNPFSQVNDTTVFQPAKDEP